jgi:branched-subunit amino acid transport protein
MEVRAEFWIMVLGAALVTVIPRVLPLVVLSRMRIPEWGLRWLGHIPVAAMSALLAQALFVQDGTFSPSFQGIAAALPAFAVAYWTRSLLLTVVTGIAATMLLRYAWPVLMNAAMG